MGFKDTMATLRGVLNVVALATDDDTHETFISAPKIAARSGVSESGVRRALNVLEDLNVINRKKQYRSNGGQSSDLIILVPLVTVTTAPVVTTNRGAGQDDQGGWSPRPGTPGHGDDGKEIIQKDHPVDHPLITTDVVAVDRFDEFYAIWPKKVGKPNAKKAWVKAIKLADPDEVIAGARLYAQNPHLPDRQFIPHPATWLNRHGWNDDLPTAPSSGRPTPTQRAAAIVQAGQNLIDSRRGLAPVTTLNPKGLSS